MIKVLILAYDFPPYISVGGLRPYSWYKYFNEFGIYPIVVTRQWDNLHGNNLDYIAPSKAKETIIEETKFGKIVRAPYKPNLANKLMLKYGDTKFRFIRKIVSAYYEYAQFLIPVGPKSCVYKAAQLYLEREEVDVVIASGDPFVLFKYAAKISKKHNVPWIADYRDAWSQIKVKDKGFIFNKYNTFFEKRFVKTASVITTVSEFLSAKILNTIAEKKIHVLPNGYDPESINSIKDIRQQTEVLTIAFVGTIYDWHPLLSFLKVLSQFVLAKEKKKLRLNFYGINLIGTTFESELSKIVKNKFPELNDYVVVHKKMNNQLLLEELAKQNVMLLFNYYSYMGTKIFDYIGLKRAILFCYTDDKGANELKEKYYDIEEIEGISKQLQEDLIKQTQSGYLIKDEKELLETLILLYNEFEASGSIKCNTINENNYSRLNQTKELARIIKELHAQNK